MTTSTDVASTYVTSRRRQAITWMLLAVAAIALLAMRQVDGTLAQVPDEAGTVHVVADLVGPRVLTDTPDVAAAVQLWSTWDGGQRAIDTHTSANIVFVLAGMVLVGGLLHRLGAIAGKAWLLVGAWGVPDIVASVLVWLAVQSPDGNWQWLVWVARLKWVAAIALVLVVLALLAAPLGRASTTDSSAGTSLDRARQREQAARDHRPVQSPLVTLRPLAMVVGIFLLLVALPLGGPLDQFPDVFRRRIDDGPSAMVLPLLGIGVALVAVVVAGFRSTMVRPPADRTGQSRRPVAVATVLWVVIAWAVVPQVVGRLLGSPVSPRSFAPLTIFLVIALMTALRALIRHDEPLAHQVRVGLAACMEILRAMVGRAPSDDGTAADTTDGRATDGDGTTAGDTPAGGSVPSTETTTPPPTTHAEVQRAAVYVAGLAGIVTLGGGLGPLRALLPMWVVTGSRGALTLGAIALAIVLPAAVVVLVSTTGDPLRALSERPLPFRVLTGGLLAVAAGLAAFPFSAPARALGVLGITTLFLAAIAAVVGGLVALGRHDRPLPVVSSLGTVTRTPWFLLILAVWVVAGLLDTQGDYHAVRLDEDAGDGTLAHLDWEAATDDWMALTAEWATSGDAPAQGCDGTAVPLVVVAAPGGGIRAGYWTAAVLDELSALDLCGPAPIFAIGGVSGGSVGTSMWLTRQADASAEMALVADEAALGAVVAGLFGRDSTAAFIGITEAWDDRAGLLERGWERAWDEPTGLADPWVQASDVAPWAPIALLHGSSSTTGCRTVVTNTGHLAAADQAQCLDEASGDGPLEGTATLLTTPTDGAVEMTQGLRASTAALLSARFPVVSPSGRVTAPCGEDADDDCTGTHWVVDGGYYENTGLLSMAQLLPEVLAHVEATRPPGLPATIEPWVVIANNAAPTAAVASGRPNEVLVPLTTKLNSQVIGPESLTQGLAEETDDNIVDVRPGWRPAITPPLGWSLSPTTMCEMDRDIADFFDLGPPRCETPTDPPDVAAGQGDPGEGELIQLQPAPVEAQRSQAQQALQRLEATGRSS